MHSIGIDGGPEAGGDPLVFSDLRLWNSVSNIVELELRFKMAGESRSLDMDTPDMLPAVSDEAMMGGCESPAVDQFLTLSDMPRRGPTADKETKSLTLFINLNEVIPSLERIRETFGLEEIPFSKH